MKLLEEEERQKQIGGKRTTLSNLFEMKQEIEEKKAHIRKGQAQRTIHLKCLTFEGRRKCCKTFDVTIINLDFFTYYLSVIMTLSQISSLEKHH